MYDVVIGIEIHCELKTKTKMFSSAPINFEADPNTCVNEIDLAMPGTLPVVNKMAVSKAIEACTAFNCDIDPLVKFDRKNYYYSDLPKGYQITQQFHPIGRNGKIVIDDGNGNEKEIRINRIHMEEDTAKQLHLSNGTYIDFNRAGTPLIEIVSEPDMTSAVEAQNYVDTLRNTLYYLGVSDCKMEEGSLRCDVNISLKPQGSDVLGTKCEIKNLNSISNVGRAIEYEIERQSAILDQGGEVEGCTRRFDEGMRETVLMRKKEGVVDYKYFPDANIVPIRLDDEWIKSIQSNMAELPQKREERYLNEYQLSEYDAKQLVMNKEVSDFYDEVVRHTKLYKQAANWVLVELVGLLNKENKKLIDCKIKAVDLASLVEMINDKTISGKQGKEVFLDVYEGKDPKEVVKAKGMQQISDESSLLALINEVLDANPQSIEDYKNGKDRAVGFLVGQVMKKSKGQANPAMTNKLIVEELQKK